MYKYRSITIANVDVTTGSCVKECGTVILFVGTVGNRVGDTKPLCFAFEFRQFLSSLKRIISRQDIYWSFTIYGYWSIKICNLF